MDARLCGRLDAPLSSRGLREARALRAWFLGLEPDLVAVVTSPLRRALATTREMLPPGVGQPAIVEELQEIDCGQLEGQELARIQQEYPDLWAANLRQDDEHFRWPGGESYAELRARSLRAMNQLAMRYAGRTVVAVTHAGVIGQLLGATAGVGAGRWSAFLPANASITELDWRQDSGTVVRFDSRHHLLT